MSFRKPNLQSIKRLPVATVKSDALRGLDEGFYTRVYGPETCLSCGTFVNHDGLCECNSPKKKDLEEAPEGEVAPIFMASIEELLQLAEQIAKELAKERSSAGRNSIYGGNYPSYGSSKRRHELEEELAAIKSLLRLNARFENTFGV